MSDAGYVCTLEITVKNPDGSSQVVNIEEDHDADGTLISRTEVSENG